MNSKSPQLPASALPPSALPQSVVQRLQAERARIENGAFTSSLGVGEMLLARESGYRVLGQVMGACVYQFGGQWTNANWRNQNWENYLTRGLSSELTALSGALSNARELALARLGAEAQLLGASGVVGVKLRLKTPLYLGQNQIEFSAIGTAVTEGTNKNFVTGGQTRAAPPFLSNLSGEETWKLERAGWAPCGFVMGNCALLQALSLQTRRNWPWFGIGRFGLSNGNFEVEEYTRAVYQARQLALSRLERAAARCGARGIVGTQIEMDEKGELLGKKRVAGIYAQMQSGQTPPRGAAVNSPLKEAAPQLFSFVAYGTAIRPRAGRAGDAPISLTLALK